MLASERARNRLKLLVTVIVSLAFAGFFIRSIDIDQVADSLGDADYLLVAPALGLFALSVIFRSLRWRAFLLGTIDLTWLQLLPSVLIGYAGNNLLPLRAGELVRAQYLSDRFGVPRMRTFGALLMERLFDGAVLSSFLLWGLVIDDAGTAYLTAGILLAIGTATGFVLCTAAALNPELPARIAALPLPIPNRIREEIAGLGGSFLGGFSVLTSLSSFMLATLSSVAAWALELAMYWLIAQAFDLKASVTAVAFAGAAANVSLSLPLAQGGFGAFEVFATKALRQFHVPENAAAAYALALHFFLIVPVSIAGLVVLWRSTMTSAAKHPNSAPAPIAEDV